MRVIERDGFILERHWYRSDGLCISASVMRPPGRGPFPVVVWNHNSRIRITDGGFEDETQNPTVPDDAPAYPGVKENGWLWFFPEGRGYAGSEGTRPLSLAPGGPPAIVDYLGRRADDALAGIDWLLEREDVRRDRLVMAGASHGGMVTLLAAARRPATVSSVVVQAPGVWTGRVTPGLDEMGNAITAISAPVLIQHFSNDRIVPIEVSRALMLECSRAGKRNARLIEYEGVDGVDGHFQFLPGNYERMVPDLIAGLASGLDAARTDPVHAAHARPAGGSAR